ncbi:MAG: hypothetical protein V3S54_06945 [Woeseiaceae bacterium]
MTIGEVTTAALIGVPAGVGPFPGVVATFHRGGLDGFTGWLVDELAANGYGAIAPDHYHALPEGVDAAQRRDYLTDEQMALDSCLLSDANKNKVLTQNSWSLALPEFAWGNNWGNKSTGFLLHFTV